MICHPHVKINLGLHVLRRRDDGFHDLETLFVPFHGIRDTLEIVPGDSFLTLFPDSSCHSERSEESISQSITPDGKVLVTIRKAGGVGWDPAGDLTVRAYQLLDADFHLPPVKIYLEKHAPVGAGLGGGSSDAAFALKMVAGLFSLDLSDEALAGYASRLGSDCAFFVYDCPMLGTGRGEVLSQWDGMRLAPDGSIVLRSGARYRIEAIVPEGISVSTAEAYRGIVPMERTPGNSLTDVLSRPVERWRECLVNDFETTVFAVHPTLARYKEALYERGAVYAAMSGSGSALFGLFPELS